MLFGCSGAGAVDIIINGSKLNTDAEPELVSDRVFIPIRAVTEAFGANVSWDDNTQTVLIKLNDDTVNITIGSNVVMKNGVSETLDCIPFISHDRTFVPVRFIAESFGARVVWDDDEKRVLITYPFNGQIVAHYIDVGQADAEFVEFPDGSTMLIDAGESKTAKDLIQYIKALGYDEITYVVATHPHSDHIGGMADVFGEFQVDNFYLPSAVATSKTFEKMLDAAENEGCPIIQAKAGVNIFDTGTVKADFLSPVSDKYKDLNDYSAAVKIVYDKNSFLFMGDCEKTAESELNPNDVRADVLKVGHHGSDSSSGEAFIAAVSPVYAVISVGENNSYNHPCSETLDTLEKYGAKIYRTDKDGTIVIYGDGNNYEVTCEK